MRAVYFAFIDCVAFVYSQRESSCPGKAPFVDGSIVSLCAGSFPTDSDTERSRWVVHFYGAECRKCYQIAPFVSDAAGVAASQTGIRYGAIDCHHPKNHLLCKEQRAWKLPMLKALGGGAVFTGSFEANRIHEWALSVTGAQVPLPTRAAMALCPAYELYDEPRMALEFLRAHNVYRCTSGLNLLTWDAKAFVTAKRWANKAPLDKLQHSPEDDRAGPGGITYGENVAIGTWLQPGQVVARWYDEIRSTKEGRVPRPFHQAGLGHYTQLVWRSTTSVACSMGQSRRVVVCHYFPPGNERGRHLTQVAPPLPGFSGLHGEARCGGPVDAITV